MFALVVLFPRQPGMAILGDRIKCERDLCSDPMQLVLGNAGLGVALVGTGCTDISSAQVNLYYAQEILCKCF